MASFLRDLYLPLRLFGALGALAALSVAGFYVPAAFALAKAGTGVLAALVAADAVVLWRRGRLEGARTVPPRLSNGDANPIALEVVNGYPFAARVRVLDEVPVQFQYRERGFEVRLAPGERRALTYTLRPTERGVYAFGALNLYAASPLGLVLRRFRTARAQEARVYPSVLQMQRYAFLATSDRLAEAGVRRVRRLGHTMEFDQVRPYVTGDDRRAVNWKATARRGGALMANQFQEERAQPVYAALDMGRTMRTAFDGLTLLDHAINAALVLLNTALLKHDRAGLVLFDDAVRAVVPAERRRSQLPRLLETLHRQTATYADPSYEALLAAVEARLRQRGLLFLFANFDTRAGLRRQLPYLRRMARRHRLVVVFFENTGLGALLATPATRAEDVYVKAFAETLDAEKREIARELERHGIGALLTRPETLTVDAINRYLALKARGAF